MDLMVDIYDTYVKDKATTATATVDDGPALADDDLVALYKKQIIPMMEQVYDQREKLAREVERWCKERGV
jgi:indoleamine 2,3-dioxygenase